MPTVSEKSQKIVALVLAGLQVAMIFGAPVSAYVGWLTLNEAVTVQVLSSVIGLVQSNLPSVRK